MSSFHNNQLKMVSLSDDEQPDMGLFSSLFTAKSDSPYPIGGFHMDPTGPVMYSSYDCMHNSSQNGRENEGAVQENLAKANAAPDKEVQVKEEPDGEVSYAPSFSSEDGESDYGSRQSSRIPPRTPKINKDGAPRKPRQPRPKLLKWNDNDWKNVVLGIIWACGETGVQIPFDQAAQVVGENCTAGAMQQAILKLRQKQIDAGYQIPSLRMAWTRKNRNSFSSVSGANAKTAQTSPSSNVVEKAATPASRRSRIVKLKLKRSFDVAPTELSIPMKASPRSAEPEAYPENTVRGSPAPINDEYFTSSGLLFDMPSEDPTDALLYRDQASEAQAELLGSYPSYMSSDDFAHGGFTQNGYGSVFGEGVYEGDEFEFH
jgi:hypothetical protein